MTLICAIEQRISGKFKSRKKPKSTTGLKEDIITERTSQNVGLPGI